jgi:hypothetical protein
VLPRESNPKPPVCLIFVLPIELSYTYVLYLDVGSSNILLACGQPRKRKLKCPQCIRINLLITILDGPQDPRNKENESLRCNHTEYLIHNLIYYHMYCFDLTCRCELRHGIYLISLKNGLKTFCQKSIKIITLVIIIRYVLL